MSCYYPLLAEKREKLPSGKYKYLPIARYSPELKERYPDSIMIPCGKCVGCRCAYTRQWADRMMLELDYSEKAVFLTLTYNDYSLPVFYNTVTSEAVPTLRKRDMQLFFKSLRKHFKDRQIRYYYCGEYGPTTHRPHYHAIVYGLGLSDFEDLKPHGINELGQQYFISESLANVIWKRGFCLLSDVSWKTCAYVARYVRKKKFGVSIDEQISDIREPTFCESSRRPGIGMHYPEMHPECFDKSKIYVSDANGSVEIWMPSAFLKMLEKVDLDCYEKLKAERSKFANDSFLMKLQQTDLYSSEFLELQKNDMEKAGNFIDEFRGL